MFNVFCACDVQVIQVQHTTSGSEFMKCGYIFLAIRLDILYDRKNTIIGQC